VQEILVDRGQLVAQDRIEKLQYLGVALHGTLPPGVATKNGSSVEATRSARNHLGFRAAHVLTAILHSFVRGTCVEHLANQRHAFAALGLNPERAIEGRHRTRGAAMRASLAIGDSVADA
jgi:hypothetical protein